MFAPFSVPAITRHPLLLLLLSRRPQLLRAQTQLAPVAMPGSSYIEAWLAGPDGHSFYTRTYPATFPKAVLLFAHGFRDHIGRHEDVHAAFAQRHVSVFAYDLRGYGRTALDPSNRSPGASYGKTTRAQEFADLEWWIKHVADMNQRLPLFLMGYSAVSTRPSSIPSRACVKNAL